MTKRFKSCLLAAIFFLAALKLMTSHYALRFLIYFMQSMVLLYHSNLAFTENNVLAVFSVLV